MSASSWTIKKEELLHYRHVTLYVGFKPSKKGERTQIFNQYIVISRTEKKIEYSYSGKLIGSRIWVLIGTSIDDLDDLERP